MLNAHRFSDKIMYMEHFNQEHVEQSKNTPKINPKNLNLEDLKAELRRMNLPVTRMLCAKDYKIIYISSVIFILWLVMMLILCHTILQFNSTKLGISKLSPHYLPKEKALKLAR